jgi:pSer/pThr/pTyr-binding forkhead associated (FHA) protein
MGEAQDLKDRLEAQRRGEPFLVFKDADGEQRIRPLDEGESRLTVGRDQAADICLDWDEQVSGVHAELERIAGDWMIADDGLSRNGTFVNGERIQSRQRLRDGDALRLGETAVAFHHPQIAPRAQTVIAGEALTRASLSEGQRRVLTALCRPLKGSPAYATPATNQQIADELYLSVDAVKTHLRALFAKFDVEDLPQNKKRVKLVELAFQTGVITDRDL